MNLSSVQQSAVVPIVGAILMPLRTGYGPEMAARLPDLFCVNVYKKGKIIARTNNILRVEYEDGTKQGWKLGRFHGTAEGKTIAHTRVTDMEVGDKFEPGYIIAWSDEFFERDPFVWPSVDMKMGALSHTALLENNDTLEDGSRISARLQKLMGTVMTKTKAIVLDVNQVISGLVAVGERVEYDSVLCVIEEAVSAELEKTDAALAALGKLAGSNPKAGFAGTVSSMEVFYMAGLEEMHPSIRKIVEADDKRRTKYVEDTGDRASKTGLVRRATFIHGERIEDGKVVIVLNIDEVHDQGVGDKGSFCNQLKTIHGGVLIGENYGAVDKLPIDAFFGYRSVNDRIVNSPIMQGTVNTTMIAASKEYARLFREG